MKKFLLFLFLLFSSFVFTNTTGSNTSSGGNDEMNRLLTEKIEELQKQLYVQGLIQYIEYESEVVIPDYIDTKYVEYIYKMADTLKIPTRIAFRLVYKESSFIDTVTSPAGAHGLMQLMPTTKQMYQTLLRTDTLNLDYNQEDIYIGLNYLKDLYSFWLDRKNPEKVSWRLSLASYNAGKGRVLQYKGIPPYQQTIDFVAFIYKSHSNPDFYASFIRKYENQIKSRS
jgi:soluble lytic murein transglycosylase-like protein